MTLPAIQIRAAAPGDGPALTRLAALDSAAVPSGPVLLAEVDGAPRAALGLGDGHVVADPFARTAELVDVLKVHASHVASAQPREEARPFAVARRLGLAA